MKDLGPSKQILGMSIIRDRTKGILRLSQKKYIGKVLEKFNMKDVKARCQPLADRFKLSKKQAPKTEASRRRIAKVPYASAVGRRKHWEAVKWLLLYLKCTSKATLCFSRKAVILEAFSDSDYGGCLDSEAEYMAIAETGKELVWLKNFLEEIRVSQSNETHQDKISLYPRIEVGVLPERGEDSSRYLVLKVSQPYVWLVQRVPYVRRYMKGRRVLYVWRYMKVRAVTLLKGRWFEVYRDYLRRRAVKWSAFKWEIVEMRRHPIEQFSCVNVQDKSTQVLQNLAARDQSTSVLLYPGRGQCDYGLSSVPLCLLSAWFGQSLNVIVRPRPAIPIISHQVLQSSIFTACGVVLRAVNVTRLMFFIAVFLPSSATVGFSVTLL
ncbi:hypothetical protein Tco_0648643 [Tanacetum coccineum]